MRIFDKDGVKLHAAKLPFSVEDADAVKKLLDENAELKFTLRIIEGAGAQAELTSVPADRAVVEKLLTE